MAGMGPSAESDGSTVVTLYRPEMLQARVDVRFEDIPRVSLNQSVEINNAALAAPLLGEVLFISSEADIQKNTLQVKVGIPDPPAVFKPEMLVDVTFLAPKPADPAGEATQELKIYIPRQFVLQDDGGKFVWLADQSEGVAHQRRIETGAESAGELVEVVRGLDVTSRIIVDGSDDLVEGERIVIAGEDPSFGAGDSVRPAGATKNINRLPTPEN
jgi:multidrug efflux pump subunit AcrA (membrane-fusion protein)